jgi:O-antigen ligase
VILTVLAVAVLLVVPEPIWTRLFTTKSEIMDGGQMSGRVTIWNTGLDVFLDHPFLGVGTAAFGTAVQSLKQGGDSPHNLVLEVLVEQGIIGLLIFIGLIAACGLAVWRLPTPERKLWAVVMLVWLMGGMSINIGASKFTWSLFGLLSAQAAATSRRRHWQEGSLPTQMAIGVGAMRAAHSDRLSPVQSALARPR